MTVILGDFNAHHHLWESKAGITGSNATGRALVDCLIQDAGLILHTPRDLNTRLDPKGEASTLDLVFGGGKFSSPATIKVGPDIGSDHLPVLADFGPSCKPPLIKII